MNKAAHALHLALDLLMNELNAIEDESLRLEYMFVIKEIEEALKEIDDMYGD